MYHIKGGQFGMIKRDKHRDRERDRERGLDEETSNLGEQSSIADLLKKIVTTGLGAASLTEEIIKGMLTELPDRKDVLEKILANAKTTKEEVISTIGRTVGEYVQKIDLSKEIDKILANYDVEVTAQVKFKKKDPLKKAEKNSDREKDIVEDF